LCHSGVNFPPYLSPHSYALTTPLLPFYSYDNNLFIAVENVKTFVGNAVSYSVVPRSESLLSSSSSSSSSSALLSTVSSYTPLSSILYIRDIIAFYFLVHISVLLHATTHPSSYPPIDEDEAFDEKLFLLFSILLYFFTSFIIS
jgi:hypothetical protein